jgi:hypothetical protein
VNLPFLDFFDSLSINHHQLIFGFCHTILPAAMTFNNDNLNSIDLSINAIIISEVPFTPYLKRFSNLGIETGSHLILRSLEFGFVR